MSERLAPQAYDCTRLSFCLIPLRTSRRFCVFTRHAYSERWLNPHRQVCACLEMIRDTEFGEEFSLQSKIQFFRETAHAYGRTALLLSGGSTLGMYHIVRRISALFSPTHIKASEQHLLNHPISYSLPSHSLLPSHVFCRESSKH